MSKKRIAIVAVIASVFLGLICVAAAAQLTDKRPTVVYNNDTKSFVFRNVIPYEGNTYPNLFSDSDFSGMMPGDAVTQQIVVRAEQMGESYAELYLYAESLNEDITEEEAKNWDLLMENTTILVSWTGQDRKYYHDELEAKDGRVHLGTFYDEDEVTVQVDFGFNVEAGNELQNIRAEVGWVFLAEVFDLEPKPTEPVPTSPSEPTDPSFETEPTEPTGPELEKDDHFAYVIGYPDGKIKPEGKLTRAEVATIFFRLLTDSSRKQFWAQNNPYYDVYAHEWFNNAISTMTNAGILRGRPNNIFGPNDTITRAEFATITARFFVGEEFIYTKDAFSDISGHWGRQEINIAYSNGLLNGYPDGTFRPDQSITRAEAMSIVNRLLERCPDKDHLLDDMTKWPDNADTKSWYYAAVQEATNSHTYEKVTDTHGTVYEIWHTIEPVRDWAALEKEWSEYNSATGGEVVSSKEQTVYR